ncbi:hypothetical protein K1719_009665 [Acacia pycnantha]|nr:hypothetical protein K1719_009665 [Acacia pycnantha]
MNTSFSELLASPVPATDNPAADKSRGLSDRIAERTGSGVPKFKSTPPPSLPLSPPTISPSSYFSIPARLSPTELLDSPVLLNASNILPSPTTRAFSAQNYNWKTSSGQNLQNIKEEDKNFSSFSFQPQPRPSLPSTTTFQTSAPSNQTQQAWS